MEPRVTKLEPKLVLMSRLVTDAFHGTSKSLALVIQSEGFKTSVGDDLYLGDGVYFFESSSSGAKEWAVNHYGANDAAVLQCEIKLGRCMDLTDAEHIDFIARAADLVRSAARKRKGAKQSMELTDALVINFVGQICNLDSVRAVHISKSKGKLFAGSHFYYHSRLYICVRNLRNILRTIRVL